MLKILTLNDQQWFIAAHEHMPHKEPIPSEEADQWAWDNVELPLDVYSHLKKAEKIAEPLIKQNDLLSRWVEDVDWVVRTTFHLPAGFYTEDEDPILVLRDLDCYAEILLNGITIGSTANQFREHRFPLSGTLKDGSNQLLIYFRSAKKVNEVLERAHGELPSGFDTPRVHARRSQCLTGWDWAARLSSVSILSPPQIVFEPAHLLDCAYVSVREIPPLTIGAENAEFATLNAQIDIVARRKAKASVSLQIIDAGGQIVAEAQNIATFKAGRSVSRFSVRLENPRIWWPVAMGSQPMYRAVFHITGEDRGANPFTSHCETPFAIRTCAIYRQKDTAGESFIPQINAIPVFCRGANWIPVSMLPAEATESDYRNLITAATASGMNCLRVWGGGIYERDIFYDTCDRLGILVWQDFMFACAAYPTYGNFIDEVEQEANYQVRRLRNHPCIFLWCGNNENEWLHQTDELRKGSEKNIIGEKIWASILKRTVEDQDPSRPYHQSSPYGRDKQDFNDEGTGDRHNWECWSRWQTPEVYMRDNGRFLSEFGFQALPALESIRTFAPDAQDIEDGDLLHHQKMIQGQERLIRYSAEIYGLPRTLEEWVDGTQRLQAEVLRRAVEHWRRRKFQTAGALIWQLNDAYPAISWSLIDYYMRPKLAYQYAQRFMSPVLLSATVTVAGYEAGAVPREVWPHDLPAAAPSVQVAGPHNDKQSTLANVALGVKFVLINDTAHEIAGQILIHVKGGSQPRNPLALPVTAQPNANSDPVTFSFEELDISNLQSSYIEAVFEPDDTSHSKLHDLENTINSACAVLLSTPGHEMSRGRTNAFNVFQALRAELLLVEPKYFNWPDGATYYGQSRPAWL